MSVIRAFIAIELPSEIQDCLEKVASQLQEQMGDTPVRWAAPQNIHLTLKFLGDVSPNNLEVLTDMLQAEAAFQQAMVISIGGLGAYPKLRTPRVIWVGVEAPSELVALQRSIDAQTARVGYARDRRPFSSHLTLGRVSRNASPREIRKIGDVLNSHKVGYLGVARIRDVHLFRSDLKPGGAVYTKLFTANFEE
ncbi:MAG: RNA 2',3'-cyclic phosphodiesterase [Chloroflexi bacterium]|nr:RNA 2',3'-cyclic phosphodiesterase [Chloroflexota bacterium]